MAQYQDAWKPAELAEKNWSHRYAAHLYRRAGFGGTIREIDTAVEAGLESTLSRLFDMSEASSFESEMAMAGRMVGRGTESRNLAAWWLLRMVRTPVPLLEKATLFWHGHFATGGDKVTDANAMLAQNNMLRKHALAKFQPMVEDVSRDVAMLTYLDSTENRKTRPNENYARELMELFCLGPGNYTEDDIKEIARCFTGWEIRRGKFRFNKYQHDEGTKTFLAKSGSFGGEEAIRIVIEQPACAEFIAAKLIRFFVFDRVEIPSELVKPLASKLRASDFDIAQTLQTIFRSQFFYSDEVIGNKIKSPVELAVGTLRFFDAANNMQTMSTKLAELGQLPLYPPNVKGWDGGKNWINASTVLARANLVAELLQSSKFETGSLDAWVKRHAKSGVGNSTDWLQKYLLAVPLPEQIADNDGKMASQQAALRLLTALAALPEFQLC